MSIFFPELRHISAAALCHLLQQGHEASHMIAQKKPTDDPKTVHPI